MLVSDLLASEADWIKGPMAVDANGVLCGPTNLKACRWCLLGAICKCYPTLDGRREAAAKLQPLVVPYGFNSLSEFSDNPNTTFGMLKGVLATAGV